MQILFPSQGVAAGALDQSEIDRRIRQRAYEIYLARGRKGNRALEDWLKAKEEILNTRRKAHAA
jgi:hypothetical protein